MENWEKYIVKQTLTIRQTLTIINDLGEPNCVLFVTDDKGVLLGTVTDGDIRRGLIADAQLEQPVLFIANRKFKKMVNGNMDVDYVRKCKQAG